MDTTEQQAERRDAQINELRDAIEWLEQNPDVPVPTMMYGSAYDWPTIAAVCVDDDVTVLMSPTPILQRRFGGLALKWTSDGAKLTDAEYRPSVLPTLTPAQLRDKAAT